MEAAPFIVTLHMVSSLDGFIAKKDNSVSWFETADHYEKGVSSDNPDAFLQAIDCYVMGAHTYEHALALSLSYGWPYGDIPTFVVTNRNLPTDRENIQFYSGDLTRLVHERLKPTYKNVWLVGGAMLAKEFLRLHLVDELRMPVLPIILGDGLLFFDAIGIEQALHLKGVTAYQSGMVELWYEIKKE